MSSKDSMLDSLMKGIGRQLGKRRKEVHQAIDRFKEEANGGTPPPATDPLPATAETEASGEAQDESSSHEAQA